MLANEINRLSISTALITNHHMKIFAGSELVTYDIALLLKNLGINVTIATFVTGGAVSELCKKSNITLIDLTDEGSKIVGEKFDLLWGHHWPVWGLCINELSVKYRYFICSSLSPFVPLEAIPHVAALADKVLLNSKENFNLISRSSSHPILAKSTIFLNSLSDEWFTHSPPPIEPDADNKNIFVISNHIPEELYELEAHLAIVGVHVTYIGHQQEQVYISPDKIKGLTAIITIGHSVQKAIASNIKVYCYDHFGGPGWIDENNFDNAQDFNFSGRCCNRKISSKKIASEIIEEIENPSIDTKKLANLAFERFNLSRNMLLLFKSLNNKSLDYINTPRNDDFFRKITQQYCNQVFKFGLSPNVNLSIKNKLLSAKIEYFNQNPVILFFRIDQGLKNIIFNTSQSYTIGGLALSQSKEDTITGVDAIDNSGNSLNATLTWNKSPGLYSMHQDIHNSNNARFSIKFNHIPDVKYIDIILKTCSEKKILACRVSLKQL